MFSSLPLNTHVTQRYFIQVKITVGDSAGVAPVMQAAMQGFPK